MKKENSVCNFWFDVQLNLFQLIKKFIIEQIQQELGIKAYDALHIASAEEGKADIFLSTDDKIIKASKRNTEAIKVEIENPLIWLQRGI